jgi:hypothetical protein
MTILSENLGLAQLSNHAQFRGAKFSKMIQFGVDVCNSSILLEGVMLFSRDMGIEDQEEFMRANGKIQRVGAVKDDVGNLSFWMKDDEVHCQMELLAFFPRRMTPAALHGGGFLLIHSYRTPLIVYPFQ